MEKQMHEITNCKSAVEVLEVTGNTWKPMDSMLYDRFGKQILSHKAILREDTQDCLGIVGKGYQSMNLEESFSIFDPLVQSERITLDSLKVFEGGKKVVYSANLESFEVKENDVLTPKLNIVQSFDGSNSYRIFFTMFRLICKNGLVGLSEKSILSIKHTRTMPERIQFAEVALQKAFEYFEGMKQISFEMVKTKINDSYVDMVLNELLGDSQKEDGKDKTRTINMKNTIYGLFKAGQGNAGETKWDLLNGITEYSDWYRGSEENRDFSNTLGSGFDFKQKAFQILSKAV